MTADLSGLNIEMRGDFYVAVEGDPTARFSPMIGADTSNPDEGRSWWIWPGGWISASEFARLEKNPALNVDFGIRVVVALPHSLTIDSNPRIGSLVVDGTNYATTQLPLSFTWIQGSSHILHVPSEVIQVSEDTRFVFVGWSDGSKENPRTVTVTKEMRLTALWKKQFLLTIVSEYGSPKGGGWYDEGASAIISIGTPVEISSGTRAVFRGWAGDVSSSETTITIVMNSPKKVTALWKLQHLLTIDSGGGLVSGGGWYDAGSIASIKALTPPCVARGCFETSVR